VYSSNNVHCESYCSSFSFVSSSQTYTPALVMYFVHNANTVEDVSSFWCINHCRVFVSAVLLANTAPANTGHPYQWVHVCECVCVCVCVCVCGWMGVSVWECVCVCAPDIYHYIMLCICCMQASSHSSNIGSETQLALTLLNSTPYFHSHLISSLNFTSCLFSSVCGSSLCSRA